MPGLHRYALVGCFVLLSLSTLHCGKDPSSSPPDSDAPELLSLSTTGAFPGAIVTANVGSRSDPRGLQVLVSGKIVAVIGAEDHSLAFMVPLLPPGSAEVKLVDQHGVGGNSINFNIQTLPGTGLPPGVLTGRATTAVIDAAMVLKDLVSAVADSGYGQADSLRILVSELQELSQVFERCRSYTASLPDSDRAIVDGLLASSGLAEALGITGSRPGLKQQVEALHACLRGSGEFSAFRGLVLGDNISFVLSAAKPIITAVAVAAFAAGGAPGVALSIISFAITCLDSVIEGYLPTDLQSVRVTVTPALPPDLEVGETASVVFTGMFVSQSSPGEATIKTSIAGVLVFIPAPNVDALLAKVAEGIGLSATASLFSGPKLLRPIAVPVDMAYYQEAALQTYIGTTIGAAVFPGMNAVSLLGLVSHITGPFPDTAGSSVAFASNLVAYDPARMLLTARQAGTIASSSIALKCWRMAPLCGGEWWSAMCLGVEWPSFLMETAFDRPTITIKPGQPPACQVTPSQLDFASVQIGQTKDLTFAIKNTGSGTLTGTVSERCPVYSIQSGSGSYSLSANQETTVTVRFAPTSAGSQMCTVGLGATVCGSVGCSGTGTEQPPVTGSCCAPAGTCTVTTEATCAGTWTAGGVCTPELCPGLVSSMVLVPAGSFTMGSPSSELGRSGNETQYQVTLTKPIYVSTYEVMQWEWQAVMGWNESSFLGTGRPVEQVTWYDAVSYCNQRSTGDGYTPAYTITGATMDDNHITSATVTWNQVANGYRLLTEAEWEYACRATSTTAFWNGGITNTSCSPMDSTLDLVGWYCGNASSTTSDCGGKSANAWGLKDMHGNVWEWCWDWYGSYTGDATDPFGPPSGSIRVVRGGSWRHDALSCRSASRGRSAPINRGDYIGLRLGRTPP